MKRSLFTAALVAAGAVIYLLSKNKKEDNENETPEIKLIDLKKDDSDDKTEENHNEEEKSSVEEVSQEEAKEEPAEEEEEAGKCEEEHSDEEQPAEEQDVASLIDELKAELRTESEVPEPQPEKPAEPVQEEAHEAKSEKEETPVNFDEKSEAPGDEDAEHPTFERPVVQKTEEHDESETSTDDFKPDHESEESVEIEDLKGRILSEVEQEVSDFNRGFRPQKDEAVYSETVYEISDLYPYLSYEMIDEILDANISFNRKYRDNQPIRIVHRVGFDKIEDLIEFVILIKEHDYRVEENNGLDMIAISKDLIVEDTIIISDIFNVSNQVYRLHGQYKGYEIIEQ